MSFLIPGRKRHLPQAALLCLLILLGPASSCLAGLKIFFLRHAEGGHNIVKQWIDKPKEEWPPYVGKENMLTPKGEEQVAAVPAKLAPYHFDFIACSPTWRTRKIIEAYLKQKETRATIWPELEEYPHYYKEQGPLPPPTEGLFDKGAEIKLPEADNALFTLRDDGRRHITPANEKMQNSADIVAIRDRTIDRIKKQFGGTNQSILLVGHGSNGDALLKALTGDKDLPYPANAALWMLEEQADGHFQVVIMNDKAVRPNP